MLETMVLGSKCLMDLVLTKSLGLET